MKTVFLFAVAVLVSTVTFSQVHLGGQVSGSVNSGYFEVEEQMNLSQKAKAGFSAGIVSEVSLTDHFSLRPSLNFVKKGVKLTGAAENTEGQGTVKAVMDANLNYLELPVIVAYSIPLNSSKVYFGIGPSVGYGLAGKTKMTYSVSIPGEPVSSESEKVNSFKNEDKGGAGFKRFDASAVVLAGLQFENGVFVNASGVYGLSNNIEGDGKYQGRSAALTVGFLLK